MFALPCLIPVIALTVANGALAPAPSLSRPSEFDVSLKLDAPVLGASAIMLGTSLLLSRAQSSPVATGLRSGVFSVDRIGSFRRSASQDLVSTLIMGGLLIGAPLGLALANEYGGARSWRPAFLVAESMLASFAFNQLTKSFVNRPRPYTYAGGSASGDARRSFYSGHTTVSFAAVTSAIYLFHELHPDSSVPLWLGALGLLAASTVGALRVTSGMHFPTDVAVGALAGVGIGLAVPLLHKRNRNWGINVGLNQVGIYGTF